MAINISKIKDSKERNTKKKIIQKKNKKNILYLMKNK